MRSGSTGGGPLDSPASSAHSHAHARAAPPSQSGSRTTDSRSASVSTASGSWGNSGMTSSTGASSPVGPPSHAAESERGEQDQTDDLDLAEGDPNFIARVSQLPLVSGSLEWYERSKRSSRVVKYGAGLVESSFSAVSRPLANNPQLGALDDFACRQLDRLSGGGAGAGTTADGDDARGRTDVAFEREQRDQTRRDQSEVARQRASEMLHDADSAVVPGGRSRWQAVLVEAGGLGAAVSEESLKSLRYCLQWLLYATAHLDLQITTLRDFIISLRDHASDSNSAALVTASAAHLAQIKHDVVETIRKVVEVVSKYAGAALPEQAKRYVRQSILSLPTKWASAIEGGARFGQRRAGSASSGSTPTGERMQDSREGYFGASSTTNGDGTSSTPTGGPALRPTEDAAERVLTFAVESLDMLKSVTQIFGESVEKAESWIERLRIVGLDRQRHRREHSPPGPPEETYAVGFKRRRATGPGYDLEDSSATGVDAGADDVTRRKRGPRSRESTAQMD
ncbi:hypothetical protein RQP46_011452 [Phenoliferia psychrophenolica]